MQRRGHGEHFRAGTIDAIRVETAAIAQRRLRPERMLTVRRDNVQIELGFRIVPAQDKTNSRRRAQVICFIKLHALERLALGTDHLDAVGAGAERVRPGKAALVVGVQIQWIAIHRETVRRTHVADGFELALDHRAIALDAAIDRRRRVGDLRVFRAIEQAVVTPATDRLRQLGRRCRQQRGRAGQADQQPKK
ncbi:hypothetical protein D3C76_292380 [compost metagenome]